MRKELLIAIVLGLGLGLLITYGFYRARQAFVNPDYNAVELLDASPSPEATTLGTLTVISPQDETVTTATSLAVTGTTLANAYVIIFVNNEEYLTTADTTGNYSTQVNLENGSNLITVTALDENGNTTTTERTIIVSSTGTTSATESATPASASARPTAR